MQQPKAWDAIISHKSLSSPYTFQMKKGLSQMSKRLGFLKQNCSVSPGIPIMDILIMTQLFTWTDYVCPAIRHGSALEHSMCFLFLHVPAAVVRLGPCAWFWLMPVNRWEVCHSPFEVLKSRRVFHALSPCTSNPAESWYSHAALGRCSALECQALGIGLSGSKKQTFVMFSHW